MQFIADLHIHSIASGHAYSTVNENAKAAADRGLQLIALTDHGPKMPGGPHLYYRWRLLKKNKIRLYPLSPLAR